MTGIRFFALAGVCFLAIGGQACAQNTGKNLFLVRNGGVFAPARSADKDGTRRIATFLPSSALLSINQSKEITIAGEPYVEATTIHGVTVLVRRKDISAKDYLATYGTQNVVFHDDVTSGVQSCPTESCSDEEFIERGYVFDVQFVSDNVVLAGHKEGRPLSFKLPKGHFVKFINAGTATKLDALPPIYADVTWQKINSTRCGEEVTESSSYKFGGMLSGQASFGKGPIQLAATGKAETEKGVTHKLTYSGHGKALIKERLSVRRASPETLKGTGDVISFVVTSVAECDSDTPGVATPRYFSEVSVMDAKERPVGAVKFDELYGKPSDDMERGLQFILEQNGKRPFLSSINHLRDYQTVQAVWLKATQDLSLATILLEHFNASCRYRDQDLLEVRSKCARALPLRTIP